MRYAPGEYIPLQWQGHPDEVYVAGHIAFEAAQTTMQLETDGELELGNFRHIYARWSLETSIDGPRQVFVTYAKAGRGRFPITAADVTGVRRTGGELLKTRCNADVRGYACDLALEHAGPHWSSADAGL